MNESLSALPATGDGTNSANAITAPLHGRNSASGISNSGIAIAGVANPGIGGASGVRSVDRDLLLCLRSGEPKTIGDLTEILGVTATAVRQRVERLLEIGLIEREKVVAGRGRPTFRYLLTVAGYRRAGADASDFAEAMWFEILDLPDGEVREGLVTAIAKRMGRQYAAALEMQDAATATADQTAKPETAKPETTGLENTTSNTVVSISAHEASAHEASAQFGRRLKQLSQMLQDREIPAFVSGTGLTDLPVLDIEACPYPNLTDASVDRTMCRLEEKMLSEALGKDVHLSSCRLDGDSCCQFSAKPVRPVSPTQPDA